MAIEIRVPNLPESVSSATVATWHLKAGDAIEWEVGEDGIARVRKARGIDWAWHHAISKTLEAEWLSPEDEDAWQPH